MPLPLSSSAALFKRGFVKWKSMELDKQGKELLEPFYLLLTDCLVGAPHRNSTAQQWHDTFTISES